MEYNYVVIPFNQSGEKGITTIIYSVVDLRIRFGAEHHTTSRPVVAIILTYKDLLCFAACLDIPLAGRFSTG